MSGAWDVHKKVLVLITCIVSNGTLIRIQVDWFCYKLTLQSM